MKVKNSILKEIWEWIYTILIALAIALVIKGFLFDIVLVDGSSMYPTLEHKDRLVITKLFYTPENGDIVILDSTYKKRQAYYDNIASSKNKEELNFAEKIIEGFDMPEEYKSRYYVKRVIATPGQTVDIRDGKVYVDNMILEEEYYSGDTFPIDASVTFPITIEDEHVFVMGDNRHHSTDSRASSLGQVPYDAVIGQSKIRIFPLNKISLTK